MKKCKAGGFPDNYRALSLAIIILFISFCGSAQTYNPSLFTVTNKSLGIAQAVPTDARSQFWDNTNFVARDYQSVNEVWSYLNLPKYRTGHFPIYIHLGGALGGNGVWSGGITQVWFFKDSTANANLVRWFTDSTATSGFLLAANNLSDVANIPTTRSNLGLGPMALLNSSAGGDLGGTWPAITVNRFNGQLPSFYLNYNNLTNKPVGLSLTTTGSSGVATYNSGTGILNIPNYATGGGGGACLNCNADTIGNIPLDFSVIRNNYQLILDTVAGTIRLVPPDSIWRTPGVDSIFYSIQGRQHAILDSLGGGGGGGGSVTSVSFTNANGFTGSVATSTTTPNLTLGTSVTGLIFGNGTALGAATVSSPLTYSTGTLGIQVANTSQNGYLSSTDWNTFNNKKSVGVDTIYRTAGKDSIQFLINGRYHSILDSAGGGGGSGTVTSFSAGTLSPLFTTSVATATTTPSLSFSLSNAAANTAFGNFTGSSAAPAFGKVTLAAQATNTANTLMGYDGSGNPTDVTAGTNITILSGVISATGGGSPQGLQQVLAINRDIATNDSINLEGNKFKFYNNGHVFIGDTVRSVSDTIITLGDSWTVGLNAAPNSLGYSELFSGYINSIQRNLAVTGSSSTTLITNQLPSVPSYNSNYRYITVMIGINDESGGLPGLIGYKSNLQKILDTLIIARGYPLNRIIVFSPGFTSINNEPVASAFADTALSVATSKGVAGINMYSAMLSGGGPILVTSDSLHPNNSGHRVLANTAIGNINYRSGNLIVAGNIGVNNSFPQYNVDVSGNARISTGANIDTLTVGRGGGRIASNTVLGLSSLAVNRSGISNVAIGPAALIKDTSGSFNVAIGENTITSILNGQRNVAIGNSAGFSILQSDNVFVGHHAGILTTSGDNVAIGSGALSNQTSGSPSIAIGSAALAANNANSNIAIGYQALLRNTSGGTNNVIGSFGAPFQTTASNNNLFGTQVMAFLTTGSGNTVMGGNTGWGVSVNNRSITDNNMVFVGFQSSRDSVNLNTVTLTNGIAIGYNARVYASNQAVLGNDAVTTTILRGRIMLGRQNSLFDNGKKFQDSGTAWISDTLTLPNLLSKHDSTNFKPLVKDASGNVFFSDYWPGGSGGSSVSSVSNSDATLTISPTTGAVVASIALGHANTWTGLQTQPAPIFTGLTSSGANDSVLTVDPSTGQVHRRSGAFNLFFANGLTTAGGDSVYLGGALNQATTINGAFNLSLTPTATTTISGTTMNVGGTTTNISGTSLNLTGGTTLTLNGALTLTYHAATDADYTVPSTDLATRLPTITANRTVTLPTPSSFQSNLRYIQVQNTGNAFSWLTAGGTVADAGGNAITSLLNGNSYVLYSDGTKWNIISQYSRQDQLRYNHTIFTPSNTGTVNLVNNQYNIISPAAPLVTGFTANLPSSPSDNDVVYIKIATNAVGVITYTGGTVAGGLASPPVGTTVVLVYDQNTSTWY